ncbi:MAG: hypothetical protein M1826_006433 [Phylliscum demangeonii]|nr:MAG: hypothetical protein M1826_006433 [Phylliscum demangeonii]
MPCLLEIRPGAGGGEAALFAGELLRMYRAFCSRHQLRATLLKYDDAEGSSGSGAGSSEAPLQEAILEVDSPGAYGRLRGEAGVHRVQRVPATESKGRTHTSATSVMVLPSLPTSGSGGELGTENWDDPTSDYYIDPKDVRIDIMRARGAGGQHVNTTDSAVRLTHEPTKTVVSMQDNRSQHKNREKAWKVLRSRLAQARREAREEEMLKLRRSVVGVARMGRGDKIRTYNWGQQRVTDHRSGFSVHDLDDVMQGGESLEKVMDSVRSWMADCTIGNLARRRFEYHVDHFLHQIPGIGRFFIPEVADPHSIEYLDLSEVGDPRDPHRKQLEHCVRLKWWTATRSKRLGVWTDRWEEWNRCIRDPKNGIPAGESTIAVRPRPRPFGQYYPPTATDQPPQDRFSSSLHALEHRAARAWSSTTRHLEAGVSRASSQLALAAGQSKGAGRTAMVAARTAQGIDRLEYAAGHL